MYQTVDAGCKPYMAPERIDPSGNPSNYDVRYLSKCRLSVAMKHAPKSYNFYQKKKQLNFTPSKYLLEAALQIRNPVSIPA